MLTLLSLNSETVLGQVIDLKLPSEANIIWLGENHGTQKTTDLAFEFIKQLQSERGLKYLILEAPYYTEVLLNNYLMDGSDSSLTKLIESQKGTIAYTQQVKDYYKKICALNKRLPSDKKIRAISIDIEHSPINAHYYLRSKYRKLNSTDSSLTIYQINSLTKTNQFNAFYNELLQDIKQKPQAYQSLFGDDLKEVFYLSRNITFSSISYSTENKSWDKVRDSLIYENFLLRDKEFDFANATSFAYWGANHTSQKLLKKGKEMIAAKIKRLRPEVNQATYSCLYLKSSFLFSEFEAPGIIRWTMKKEKEGYRIAKRLMNSNNIAIPANGAKFLQKKAQQDVEVFTMEGLPDKMNFIFNRNKKIPNIEYAQYVVLIQNSKENSSL